MGVAEDGEIEGSGLILIWCGFGEGWGVIRGVGGWLGSGWGAAVCAGGEGHALRVAG